MILYHGSKNKLKVLKHNQAESQAKEQIPDKELLDAIYFTPNFTTALAMAARPYGVTRMEEKSGEKIIEFEHPELFDPNQEIYIYHIESDKIPPKNLKKVGDNQYAVVGMNKLTPDGCDLAKASDVFKYYKNKRQDRNAQL